MKTTPAAPAKWSRPAIGANATVSAAFATLCTAALAQVSANAPGVARGEDPEYLHQLRVGIRRFLSALRAFRPLLRRKRAAAVRRTLRDLMRQLGTVRDWDVFVETLTRHGAPKELLARARQRRAQVVRTSRDLVDSAEFRDAHQGALRWLASDLWRSRADPGKPLVAYARRSLGRAHTRLLKRAQDIDWRDPVRRHAVRIAVKRLRYGCDFFAACFPGSTVQAFLRQLAALQGTLGELNDIAVARALLDELSAAAAVRRSLARRESALIASLAGQWRALEQQQPYWQPRAPRARRRRPRASARRA